MVSLQVLKTILNFKLENDIENFINDFDKYKNERKINYGIFELVAKRELKIKDEDTYFHRDYKRFFGNIIYKLDSQGYNLIKTYGYLLTIFIENNCFVELIIDHENNLLEIINYIKKNNNKKEQIKRIINKLLYIGINTIDFNEYYQFDDVYKIGSDENISIIYSDSPKNWLMKNNNTYYFTLSNAHYIIGCRNLTFRNGIIMKLNSFDFDINTLPSKSELFDIDLDNIIDYKDVCLKTSIINSANKIDEIIENIDGLINLYRTFLTDLLESNKDVNKLKNKEQEMFYIKQMLLDLKKCIEKENPEKTQTNFVYKK